MIAVAHARTHAESARVVEVSALRRNLGVHCRRARARARDNPDGRTPRHHTPNTPSRRPAAKFARFDPPPHADALVLPPQTNSNQNAVHCPRALDALPRCGGGGRPRPRRRRRAVRLRPVRGGPPVQDRLLGQGHHQRGDRPPQEAHPVEGGVREGRRRRDDQPGRLLHHAGAPRLLRPRHAPHGRREDLPRLGVVLPQLRDQARARRQTEGLPAGHLLGPQHPRRRALHARQQLRGRGGRRRPRPPPSVGAGAPRAPPRQPRRRPRPRCRRRRPVGVGGHLPHGGRGLADLPPPEGRRGGRPPSERRTPTTT